MIAENFISMERVCEAARDLGLAQRAGGLVRVADVIGLMTGLDMAKYEIELDEDARGYRILRRSRP